MVANWLTLREARALLPGRPSESTIKRWIADGSQGVKLRSAKFCGKRLTRSDWVAEFVDAQIGAVDDLVAHHAAEQRLREMGV